MKLSNTLFHFFVLLSSEIKELEFEYGYNLKIYPDDPVEVAMKGGAKSAGPSIGNWISNVLSPVDASAVPPPPVQD